MSKSINRLMIAIALLTAHAAYAGQWEYVDKAAATTTIAALTPPTNAPFFTITKEDVEKTVAENMIAKGIAEKSVRAIMDPLPNPVLYSADRPLKISIQALQVDRAAKRWQGQAYIMSNRSTETVRPVAGRFEVMISVPVLSRQFNAGDVIESKDITMRDMPERQLRKDTITSAEAIIGKSPLRMISADRPIRAQEVAMPSMIKKGDIVQMSYTTNYMLITDQGEALQDGTNGALIRVKNSKTGRAVSARVAGAGQVEVNTQRNL